MDKRYVPLILLLIFLATLGIRLFFAYQTPYFTTDRAYFHLRQVQHIQETGIPLFLDPLHAQGIVRIFLPLYDYVLAVFTLFLPLEVVAKVLPNIFASLLIFIMYLLVYELTRHRNISFLCSAVSGIFPLYLRETLLSVSVSSLTIPLFFLLIYFFFRKSLVGSIIVFCFLLLLQPSVFLFLLGMIIYFLLITVEKQDVTSLEKEFFLFSLFLSLWFYFLVFKRALLLHGLSLLWGNIPSELVTEFFYDLSLQELLYTIGVLPFVGGIYVIYRTLFLREQKIKRETVFLLSMCVAIFLLLWLKLLAISVGVLYLGLILILLSSQAYLDLEAYFHKTKFEFFHRSFFVIVIGLAVLSLVIPSLIYASRIPLDAPSPSSIAGLLLLKQELRAPIIALPREGNLIAYYTSFPVLFDFDFILEPEAQDHYRDLSVLYTTHSRIVASRIMDSFYARYVYVSPDALENFNVDELALDESCFHLFYKSDIAIYEYRCSE